MSKKVVYNLMKRLEEVFSKIVTNYILKLLYLRINMLIKKEDYYVNIKLP